MKRRDFVGAAAGAVLGFGGIQATRDFPVEPRKRIAVSSYPFRRLIASADAGHTGNSSGMTLEQFAQTIGPKFDVAGIEPWSRHIQSPEESSATALRRAFDSAGVKVVNIPVDARVHVCGSAEDRKQGLAIYRKWVDAAVILGSPSIRVHLPRGQKADDISCSVSVLKELAEYSATKKIVINVENDNPDSEAPEKIVRVLKAVNSPSLRSLPDFCNSMLIKNSQTYNEQALSSLFPLAYNISHVKDVEIDGQKEYRVDMDRIFAIAKGAGYKGYFSIEWEGRGDEYVETNKLIAATVSNLEKV
jgi:sugar phosphate isomerase/epimerase